MFAFRTSLIQVVSTALVVFLLTTIAQAGDWTNSQDPKYTESRYQIAVGAQYRADNRSYIDAQPQFTLQFLKYMSNQKAWFVTFGYCSETNFALNSEAQTLSLEAGFRMQQHMRLMSPYLDIGLKNEYYSGKLNGRNLYDNKFGLSIGIGASLRISGKTRLDFGLQHLINSRESQPVYALSGVNPPPFNEWDPDIGLGGPDTYHLYNPTHLYLSYRVGF